MSHDQSASDLLSAADPALAVTDDELDRSRQRSLLFMHSEATHIAVGGSIHNFHRTPARRHWGRFAVAGLAAAAVAASVLIGSTLAARPDHMAAIPTAEGVIPTATPTGSGKSSLAGSTVTDSFGNVDYYTTVPGDTRAAVAASFRITEKELAGFNGIQPGSSLPPNTKLRLIPAPGPMIGAKGTAAVDADGIPVNNSFGQTIYYTTVDGDSLDSLGYKFRCTTDQLLRWNTTLTADQPILAGTKVRLMPGEVTIDGAQGTFTADADGVPLTYTTAPGDTERQVAFRFGVPEIADLESANRPLSGTDRVWYAFSDLPSGELAPGQTISLNLTKPIHK